MLGNLFNKVLGSLYRAGLDHAHGATGFCEGPGRVLGGFNWLPRFGRVQNLEARRRFAVWVMNQGSIFARGGKAAQA
jgi:hypothetical protein